MALNLYRNPTHHLNLNLSSLYSSSRPCRTNFIHHRGIPSPPAATFSVSTRPRLSSSVSNRASPQGPLSVPPKLPPSVSVFVRAPTCSYYSSYTYFYSRPNVMASSTFCGLCPPVRSSSSSRKQRNMSSAASFYDFKPLNKDGAEVPLEDYKGKVVLIVNTASECGFTPQYSGLESLRYKLRETHGDDFEILGFPCNQFAGQEPGTDEEIQNFCQVNYGVSFPIMRKIDVNGDNTAPVYDWLKTEHPGIMGIKRIKWNFEKFLIGRDGRVKGRWASITKPDALEKPIQDELEKPKPTASGDLRTSEATSTMTDLKADLEEK